MYMAAKQLLPGTYLNKLMLKSYEVFKKIFKLLNFTSSVGLKLRSNQLQDIRLDPARKFTNARNAPKRERF